jgi:hypothetical protein
MADASADTEEGKKEEWMAANYYDPAKDECGKGTVCTFWTKTDATDYSSEMLQTC